MRGRPYLCCVATCVGCTEALRGSIRSESFTTRGTSGHMEEEKSELPPHPWLGQSAEHESERWVPGPVPVCRLALYVVCFLSVLAASRGEACGATRVSKEMYMYMYQPAAIVFACRLGKQRTTSREGRTP